MSRSVSTPTGPRCINKDLAKFDQARWSVTCRAMQIRVMHGNYDAAVRLLREFCMNTSTSYATMDSNVADIFPARIANLLESVGCDTIRATDRMSDMALMAVPSIGDPTVGFIRRTIQHVKAGRMLAMLVDESESLVDEQYVAMPEHRIYMLLLEEGPLPASVIATKLGMTELEMSDAFLRSKRLRKEGRVTGTETSRLAGRLDGGTVGYDIGRSSNHHDRADDYLDRDEEVPI